MRRPWVGQAPDGAPAIVDPASRALRRGLAGAVATIVCLGTVAVLALPPFVPADESSHAAYALVVADGDLPRLEDTVEPELPGQRAGRLYLANHPPLYYAIAGPVLEVASDRGHPVAGIRLVRALSVVFAAGAVVVAAGLAGLVVRRRRAEAMILAAGVTATVPMLVSTSAMLHNDLLAVFAASVAFYGAVAALVQGPRRSNVALVCGGSAVTMATRINGASIVALACAALGLAVLLHTDGDRARRLVRAGLLALAPVVCVLLTSGWFYGRNVRIYGDVSGVGHNRDLGGRNDRYTPLGYLTEWLRLPDLLTRVEGGGPWRDLRYFGWYDRKLLAVVVAVVALGGILAGAGVVARRRSGDGEAAAALEAVDADRAERLGRHAAIGMVAVLPLLLWVQLAVYVAQTGSPNPRYLLPGVPAVAVVVAACCLAYRRRAGVVAGVGVVGFQAAIGVTTLGRWITRRTAAPPTSPLRQLARSLDAAGVPAPGLILALLLAGAAAGVVAQAAALWSAARAPSPPADGPGLGFLGPTPCAKTRTCYIRHI